MKKNKIKYNNLIKERSPYLLQHAENPVDWHAWNNETFEKALKEDKPIFLSIGYSTCHWCHVMEHESFEDDEVASLLNSHFINVKVDREERPDIDKIYMNVCQMMTGKGGWPLTIIMTPEKKPFFAATYIPKRRRYDMPGLLELIPNVFEIWNGRRDEINESSEKITESLNKLNIIDENYYMPENIIDLTYEMLKNTYDQDNGGFGQRPKFPTPHNLLFLLRYWKKTGDQFSLDMVKKTLFKMRNGGIFDHVGHGFHRYSTDEKWIVPHFEKMLYDQALLSIAYLETYQAAGDEFFKETAEEVIKYVLREMTSVDGGFFSAEDADSECVEGKFYLWELDELKKNLSEEDYKFINELFELSEEGNFFEENSNRRTGNNILYYKDDLDLLSKRLKLSVPGIRDRAKNILKGLFEIRSKRIKPHLDDKILTDWNGLMIAALSIAARVTGNNEYSIAAEKAIEFILKNMFNEKRLFHRYRDLDSAIDGNLDDYAFFVWGLLETYQATFKGKYLELAIELSEILIKYFFDNKEGALFFTPTDGENLISRSLDFYDGAIPSGNSIASYNFNRLYQLTGDVHWVEYSESILLRASSVINQYPIGFVMLLSSYMNSVQDSIEIVICGNLQDAKLKNILVDVNKSFNPGLQIIVKNDQDSNKLFELIPYLRSYKMVNNKLTFYVCRNGKCYKPSNNIDEIIKEVMSHE